MMKKFLSLLSINAIMLSVVSYTIACKKNDPLNFEDNLVGIFNSERKEVEIGINASILSATDEQDFKIDKLHYNYFQNLQLIALSVLNKIEKRCYLNTNSINVNLYRTNDISNPIKSNDDIKKDDIQISKGIYIGFSAIAQSEKNNNFKNLLHLKFVQYGKGLFDMEKEIQQPYCDSKNHEI